MAEILIKRDRGLVMKVLATGTAVCAINSSYDLKGFYFLNSFHDVELFFCSLAGIMFFSLVYFDSSFSWSDTRFLNLWPLC